MPNQQQNISLERLLRESGPSDWIVKMHEHFARTGSYRPEDMERVLGDPTKRVSIGPNADAKTYFKLQD